MRVLNRSSYPEPPSAAPHPCLLPLKLYGMVLYEDLTVKIELYPAGGIIYIEWFDQNVFRMSDFEFSFTLLMENLERYGVKKLLVQTSRTMIHLPDAEYISVIGLLQSGLAHSRVLKVAKLFVDKSERDLRCKKYFKDMLNEMELEIGFRNFDTCGEALDWLKEDSQLLRHAG